MKFLLIPFSMSIPATSRSSVALIAKGSWSADWGTLKRHEPYSLTSITPTWSGRPGFERLIAWDIVTSR